MEVRSAASVRSQPADIYPIHFCGLWIGALVLPWEEETSCESHQLWRIQTHMDQMREAATAHTNQCPQGLGRPFPVRTLPVVSKQ